MHRLVASRVAVSGAALSTLAWTRDGRSTATALTISDGTWAKAWGRPKPLEHAPSEKPDLSGVRYTRAQVAEAGAGPGGRTIVTFRDGV